MAVVVDLPLVPATPTLKLGGVEQLGQQLGAGDDRRADAPGGLHVGDGLLDRRGDHQGLVGAGQARAVLRMQHHAARAQELEPGAVAALVQRAVRALTSAPRAWTISASGVIPLPPTPQKK